MASEIDIKKRLHAGRMEYEYYSLPELEKHGYKIAHLPISIRIMLESLIRNVDGHRVKWEDVEKLLEWNPRKVADAEVPLIVSRVVMQDFTGVPAVVDLAAMREKTKAMGRDPDLINPSVPVDLVIDHSVQVDFFGNSEAYEKNVKKEFERNSERYKFLKWAQNSFSNFRIVPPGVGIVHQVNLEYLGKVVGTEDQLSGPVAFFDTLVGTDSHTTMINGLGIFGFGVGGIEAEAAILKEPVTFQLPAVVGVNLHGKPAEGTTATDIVLTLTQLLRKSNVVGKFVEFFGTGVSELPVPDRATLSNMCPEYGATVALFPVDQKTLDYLHLTGRSEEHIELVSEYMKAQKMFGTQTGVEYSELIDLDLSAVKSSISGPKLPQQRTDIGDAANNFLSFLEGEESIQVGRKSQKQVSLKSVPIDLDGQEDRLSDGDVAIAAITSCTNTSNQNVMIAAGLLAKKAVERGLKVSKKVKTSLAPGSRVVTEYLNRAGLMVYLEKLGFYLAGYGCTTCIGNSGPLHPSIEKAINDNGLSVAAVLSGNRNFEARIHKDVRANYLMSPPLVVAFALAGTVVVDMEKDPLGKDLNGRDVFLKDIWPSVAEVDAEVKKSVSRDTYLEKYRDLDSYNPEWSRLEATGSKTYGWDDNSTYIRNPPFFEEFDVDADASLDTIENARPLVVLGDSVTTDHISPAGSIAKDSPAGKYLVDHGVAQRDFNSYGSRRGNHEVMIRGTFANQRLKNLLVSGKEGGITLHMPDMKELSIYEASVKYYAEKTNLIGFAGKDYGAGSSRDWAAKGTLLLGIKAIIAESFERIHRSNLIGMGVIPLQFEDGRKYTLLSADLERGFTIEFVDSGKKAILRYRTKDGSESTEQLRVRIDNEAEMQYYRRGGILQNALSNILSGARR